MFGIDIYHSTSSPSQRIRRNLIIVQVLTLAVCPVPKPINLLLYVWNVPSIKVPRGEKEIMVFRDSEFLCSSSLLRTAPILRLRRLLRILSCPRSREIKSTDQLTTMSYLIQLTAFRVYGRR